MDEDKSAEFDEFSSTYNEYLNDAVSITGFDGRYFSQARLKRVRNVVPSLVDEPFEFLDYGCGPGNLFLDFSSYFPKGKYYGVDASSEMVREAQRKFLGIATFYDLDSEDWTCQKYDLIFVGGIFHHTPEENHGTLLRDFYRLLNDGGKILVFEQNPINPFTQIIVKRCVFDENAVLIQPFAMKELVARASFVDVKLIFTTFFPKILDFLIPYERYLKWFPLGAQYLVVGEKLSDPNS